MAPENRSLSKALALIEALASSPGRLSAVQLSHALKLTRPTVYRILKTLTRHGFVTREEGDASYRLSFKVLDLGQRVLERTDLLDVARPALRRLGASCHETVHLAVPEEGCMVYLDKLEGSGPFCTNSRLGRSVPMHCTSLGKSVLAYWPTPKARAVLMRHGMSRQTARTIVALSAMERELARVRRQGYAIDDVEFEEDVRCVGAPIFDHRGTPIAAISVSAPVSRMPLARAHQVGAMVRGGAAAISRAMGWVAGAGQVTATVIPVRSPESLAERPMNLGRPPVLRKRPERAPHQAKEVMGRR